MDPFSRHDLDTLIRQPQSHSVSLYLPTHRAGPETQQDPIDLTNLIRRAEADLVRGGLRRVAALGILHPARTLVDNAEFWRERADGLAVFLRRGWWRSFRLPVTFDEAVMVSDRFRVYPLLQLFTGDDRFFVLALSENEARLYRGSRSGMHTVPVPDMPHGVKDALRYDEPLRQGGHRLGEIGVVKVRAVIHGKGLGDEVQKERLGRYLYAVSNAVDARLTKQRCPLVLAGVDYIRAAYRDITDYQHVLDTGVAGSPDRVPPAQLHTRAWELVEPVAARDRNDAAARYEKTAGTGLASDDINDVTAAAESGRVEVLFLPTEQPERELEPLESAAVHTIRTGGTVYVVSTTDMPGQGPLAALFRY
ncbi:baeRF3 domain-containing protein [Allokutzneria oryzae]|uniref:Peptide chain release factor 1 n=1 Tax=Allokutzneria oryzae TaxID=1378989 RepID=A0ABV6A1D7_9PSEU